MKLVVEGVSQARIARAQSVCPSTVSRWTERGARHLQRFDDEHLHLDDAVELQLDELKSYGAGDRDHTWVYSAVEVWSRVWAALRVGPRTLRSTLLFVRKLRTVFRAFLHPVLVTTDEFKYYLQVLRRVFGPGCVYVQVENRYRRDRIVRTESRVLLGTDAQVDEVRARSEDSKKPNTAFIERLNLLKRRCCSYLNRRTPAPMRKPQRLTDALEVLRAYYNFIRPHAALRFGSVTRTPAMQAGLFDRPLTFREIFCWVPPPIRPTPKLLETR